MKFPMPVLAGATLRSQLAGIVGAMLATMLTGAVCGLAFGKSGEFNLLIAPMGATAVLLFMVPASPLAQPWSILFGNTLSAVIGVCAAWYIPEPALASGVAVSLAIAAMIATRSLHPPGGATALLAVVGGDAVRQAGFWFPLIPVAVNSAAILAIGLAFHKLAGANYPHSKPQVLENPHQTRDPAPSSRAGFTAADVDRAIEALHDTLDIERGDVETLVRLVEQTTRARLHGALTCEAIMSRDIIGIAADRTVGEAKSILISRRLRLLPVTQQDGTLAGIVGLRELDLASPDAPLPVAPAAIAHRQDPVVSLLPMLTDGRNHGVIIVDQRGHVEGIVSQTDLLAAMGRMLLSTNEQDPQVGDPYVHSP